MGRFWSLLTRGIKRERERFLVLSTASMLLFLGQLCPEETTVPEDKRFQLVWGSSTPTTWDVGNSIIDPVGGNGPVLRQYVTPTLGTTFTQDTTYYLELQLVIKYPDGTIRYGNSCRAQARYMTSPPPLDLGGSLGPGSGLYDVWIKGTIQQYGQVIDNATTEPRGVRVSQITPSGKTVEYDYAVSNNILGGNFSNLEVYVAEAFGATGKSLNFYIDRTDLPDTFMICEGINCLTTITRLAADYRSGSRQLYLATLAGIDDDQYLGLSVAIPSTYSGSWLFMENIYAQAVILSASSNETVSSVLIHELGHQMSDLVKHPQDQGQQQNHNSAYCVMNAGLEFVGDNDNDPNNDRTGVRRKFYHNSFFCPADVGILKNTNP